MTATPSLTLTARAFATASATAPATASSTTTSAVPVAPRIVAAVPRGLGERPARKMTNLGPGKNAFLCPRKVLLGLGRFLDQFISVSTDEIVEWFLGIVNTKMIDAQCRVHSLRHCKLDMLS